MTKERERRRAKRIEEERREREARDRTRAVLPAVRRGRGGEDPLSLPQEKTEFSPSKSADSVHSAPESRVPRVRPMERKSVTGGGGARGGW